MDLKTMQTTYHHQPKAAAKPHAPKEAIRNHDARRNHQKPQSSGLSREELRQIVIDMIG
jgi:hypothetical protein